MNSYYLNVHLSLLYCSLFVVYCCVFIVYFLLQLWVATGVRGHYGVNARRNAAQGIKNVNEIVLIQLHKMAVIHVWGIHTKQGTAIDRSVKVGKLYLITNNGQLMRVNKG